MKLLRQKWRQALEILKARRIDTVFMDIRMPKMDGLELIRHIDELEETGCCCFEPGTMILIMRLKCLSMEYLTMFLNRLRGKR